MRVKQFSKLVPNGLIAGIRCKAVVVHHFGHSILTTNKDLPIPFSVFLL